MSDELLTDRQALTQFMLHVNECVARTGKVDFAQRELERRLLTAMDEIAELNATNLEMAEHLFRMTQKLDRICALLELDKD